MTGHTVARRYRAASPGTLNLERADTECHLDYVPVRPRHRRIDVGVVDNASFGGRNSSVVLRRTLARSPSATTVGDMPETKAGILSACCRSPMRSSP